MREIDLRFNNLDYLGTVNIKHNKSSECFNVVHVAHSVLVVHNIGTGLCDMIVMTTLNQCNHLNLWNYRNIKST
jgi:hypothetical protein